MSLRGRPPITTRSEIVQGALVLARREGLRAITVARIAEHLGISQNTFYNHAATKDALFEQMAVAALEVRPPDVDPTGSWSEQLHVVMLSFYDTLIENYVLIELMVNDRPRVAQALIRAREDALDRIVAMPLTTEQAQRLFDDVGAFILGVALLEKGPMSRADRHASTRFGGDVRNRSPRETRDHVADVIAQMIADSVAAKV